MKFTIITLYPDAIKPYCDTAILGRAQKNKIISIEFINLRDFGLGDYRQVDDTPYGGGPGMVLRPDVVIPAIEKARGANKAHVILLSPKGKQFTQKDAISYATTQIEHVVLVCGRFEGIDHRVLRYVDEELSVGPYVLSGGELPALTVIETITRLLPGALGNEASTTEETDDKPEYPQYTKPADFRDDKVPEVLLSGNHAKIKKWRDAKR